MNGAEALLSTAVRSGVEVCFANPGTTEMPLVAALDRQPAVRPVLGLFEGVVTGAADGYGRMTRRPAMTLLHLGPGAANGIANLHNARRARTPVLNVIGDHATWHVHHDPPLASDIPSLLSPVSAWLRSTSCATDVAGDTADAVAASQRDGGGVATLVVPADCQWDPPASPPRRGASAGDTRRRSRRWRTLQGCCAAVSPSCSCSAVLACPRTDCVPPAGSRR
jgi:acetolactate synthase-1/2/3 large subunit